MESLVTSAFVVLVVATGLGLLLYLFAGVIGDNDPVEFFIGCGGVIFIIVVVAIFMNFF